MVKLIIFFRKPADEDAFEEHFSNHHVPLINAMPNLRRTALTRAIGAPRGEAPYYLIHEAYFEDLPTLTYALNSPEGRAAGADLMQFARDTVSLMFAEVWGEDPFELGLMGHEPAPEELEVEAPAPEPAKSNLVPINTSFLEQPAKPMTVEEAILGPDYKQAAPAEAPATDSAEPPASESTSAALVAESFVTEPASAEAPASEATPVTETEAPASAGTPAPVAEATVVDAVNEASAAQAETATPSDTPTPADPRPQ
jgi:uncharacterized protein (TIGR02118 family)